MAGMFYSLQETAQRLSISEDDVRKLAKEGKLREFRDGSNLLFKIEEVNALLAEGIEPWEPEAEAPPVEALEPEAEAALEMPAEELAEEDLFEMPVEETPELELVEGADASSELGLAPEPPEEQAGQDDDFLLLDEDEQPAAPPMADTDEEISLAPETGSRAAESDITDMDTALTGEGVSVIGETDTGYDATDDSMAETVGPAGTGTEASLEEIEDDVSLDSFGSGSGLLDLSLQADDTSLGGILDEIYTAEGAEEGPAGEEPGSVEDITAEAEHAAVSEEELTAPEPVITGPTMAPAYAAYVEVPPDTQSNMLGMLLFLPLLALLYTTIVAVAAQRNVMPSILSSIQGFVWYIIGGAAVVTALLVGASFVVGGEKAPKVAKPKKAKEAKVKKEKPKKQKKEKPAKKKGK